MTLYGVGLILVIGFFAFLYLAVGRKVWRGTSALDGDSPPEWWPFGVPVWRGVARAYIATGPFVLLLLAGGAIAELGGSGAEDPGMAIGLIGLLGIFGVQLPIIFFNRPRFAVPPHQREEPGALAERRARKRRPVR